MGPKITQFDDKYNSPIKSKIGDMDSKTTSSEEKEVFDLFGKPSFKSRNTSKKREYYSVNKLESKKEMFRHRKSISPGGNVHFLNTFLGRQTPDPTV